MLYFRFASSVCTSHHWLWNFNKEPGRHMLGTCLSFRKNSWLLDWHGWCLCSRRTLSKLNAGKYATLTQSQPGRATP